MKDGKHVILGIDDDPDVLAYLQIVLEAEGYVFFGAESAETGLQVFMQEELDAVIVDLMMEEVDAGVRFARELQIRRSDIPIFMLSSVGDDFNLTADYSSLGLAGVFQKPITKDVLLSVLGSTLAAAPTA
jgi:two-component system alkaline phosphatase synthesis response regulator PhoP